jgi:8-oxo-dGTP diphosphatase
LPSVTLVSVAYVPLAPDLPDAVAGTHATRAEWAPVSAVPRLAFDHGRIADDALERIRAKLEYTTLAMNFVSDPFTIADLRRVYEAVWGRPLDAANFRRKMLGGRPAERYRRGSARYIVPAFYRPDRCCG